jgi:hypothetical protein
MTQGGARVGCTSAIRNRESRKGESGKRESRRRSRKGAGVAVVGEPEQLMLDVGAVAIGSGGQA